MKIAVCDDEELFLKKIYQYFWKQQGDSVKCFLSPTALLEKYRAGVRYDVVFLDILMEPMNGIDLAKEIRRMDQKVVIVFLTVALEYAPAGYEVNAFRYLLKPVAEADLALVLKEIKKTLDASFDTILLETPECEILIHTEELYYLEADNKESILHYMGDTIKVRRSLSELEEELSARHFVRVHRKYLVNLAHIREFDGKNLTLDCGRTLPLSRRRGMTFRNALNKYIGGE